MCFLDDGIGVDFEADIYYDTSNIVDGDVPIGDDGSYNKISISWNS